MLTSVGDLVSCDRTTCRDSLYDYSTGPMLVQAYPIQVKFMPSDLPLLRSLIPSWWSQDLASANTTTTAGTTTSNITPRTSPIIPSATGVSLSSPQPGSSGISLSARLAIGITIPLVFFLCLAFVFFHFRYRKPRNAAQNSSGQWAKPELEVTTPNNQPQIHELQHNQVHELSTETRPTELIGAYAVEFPVQHHSVL
jgi:hypothetical protein